jgi:ribonuclease HI
MRRHWAIPTEEDLNYSGHEWLLRLIDKHDKVVMGKLVLILWRAWFIRNELTHTNRKLCIMGSVNFLMSYWESLCTIRQQPVLDLKGKRPIFPDLALDGKNQQQKRAGWVAPGRGTVKINVDGAFSDASQGSYGVVIHDEQWQVLLSAWGIIDNASSAEQVELVACNEGVKLAARWVPRPAILESDCLTAVNLILKPNSQRSPWAFVVTELAAGAIELPSISFKHVKRAE